MHICIVTIDKAKFFYCISCGKEAFLMNIGQLQHANIILTVARSLEHRGVIDNKSVLSSALYGCKLMVDTNYIL